MRSSLPKHYFFSLPYLVFVSLHTFFFPYLPPSLSCSNDFYCITIEWTTSYAYDATLPCSLFHSPLSQHHRILHTLFFLLEHALNCLWIDYRNVERYLFPAESTLTLDLWNKAIFLSILGISAWIHDEVPQMEHCYVGIACSKDASS